MASRVLRTGGLFFDGINDYVEIPYSESINIKNAITIIGWVWLKSIALSLRRISGNKERHYRWLDFEVGTGKYLLLVGDGTTWFFGTIGTWTLPTNRWFHLAYVVDWVNGWAKAYLDGVLKLEGTFTPRAIEGNSAPLYIGAYNPFDYLWLGMNDEVRIYNRALSADEISEIYSKGTFIKDGLVLCLPFYEGEGNIAHDVSGYNNHGTLYGNPIWVVKKALRVLPKAR